MDVTRPNLRPPAPEQSAAMLAKGALRRLAVERLEPTPENYARAYRQEAGAPKGSSILPARAQKLVEMLAARAVDGDTHASANVAASMAEGQWDQAERALEDGPALAGNALAVLVERIVRGVERGGQNWTSARRKVGIQRVLDASRGDVRRLHQRLSQLLTLWETDAPGVDLHRGDPGETPSAPMGLASTGPAPLLDLPRKAAEAAAPIAVESAVESAAAADVATGLGSAATDLGSADAPVQHALQLAEWQRVVEALSQALQDALPTQDDVNRELAANLHARTRAFLDGGASVEGAHELETLCRTAGRVLQHRHHLFDQLGKLTLELTGSLTELAENDSWVKGQCDAMRLKIEDGLTARGVRAVSDMLHTTRARHAELRGEREKARDALKILINRMLSELGELGSKTGNFHESVGRYAAVIEEADTLESLTGVVREMVEESRTVQSLVQQTQQRLQEEHSKATDLSERVNQLEGEMKRLSDEVSTDQLTQISNRRGLMLAFEAERARMERSGLPLSVGLLDIDNFKRLNDELGHSAGDVALKSLAAIVSKTLRPTDHVARYGGEEFVVLLPETPVDEGEQILTRLQRALTGGLFMHKDKQVFVTFSAGVTGYKLEERIEQSLERADQALYEAKRTGKNRTCIG